MKVLFLVASALISVGSLKSNAEIQQIGNYEVHYAAFPSTIIPPEVARAHRIARADDKIIINVSVKSGKQPVKVSLTGKVINLLEQVIELDFVEVQESSAIYYLAAYVSQSTDILRFNLIVITADNETLPINFMHRYDR